MSRRRKVKPIPALLPQWTDAAKKADIAAANAWRFHNHLVNTAVLTFLNELIVNGHATLCEQTTTAGWGWSLTLDNGGMALVIPLHDPKPKV